ncbi:MAG: hypothetical protein H3C62_15855 [Gemmatimonadaceae bacterium]|nr:hypothetical protein [Gemmatimonadaceae bacterium]
MANWKEHSRTGWLSRDVEPHVFPGIERVQIGCLQRIADAAETMAQNHAHLIAERDRYERWYNSEKSANATLRRRVNALRGIIARMKRGGRRAK